MTVVDASALVAILLREPEAQDLETAIAASDGGLISPVNYWEVLVRCMAVHGAAAREKVDALIDVLNINVVDCARDDAALAASAFQRFGKGRHPARLNLGDCFAYALAAKQGGGLLFKGDDFTKTDLASALP